MRLFRNKQEDPAIQNDEVRMRIVFTGIVQGVGFRYEVSKLAKDLQLSGWVQNQYDGSVLCELQGPREKIIFLIHQLIIMPRLHIDSVDKKMIPKTKEKGFRVRS